MTYTTLRYDHDGGIATVTFATPARLNAISEARLDELEVVLGLAEADKDLRALILTGEGEKAFCVGLDLDLLAKAFADLGYFQKVVTRVAGIISRLETLPVPTLAAINGLTRAGGFEFSMGCDFIVMADEARFGDAHTDSGVMPAAATTRLKRKIGDQKAKAMIWSACYLSGPEAVAWGVAIKSVPRARLLTEAKAFLRTIIDKPRAVIAANKQILQGTQDMDLPQAVEFELAAFRRYMRDEPYGREGYTAFVEKRAPSWTVK